MNRFAIIALVHGRNVTTMTDDLVDAHAVAKAISTAHEAVGVELWEGSRMVNRYVNGASYAPLVLPQADCCVP